MIEKPSHSLIFSSVTLREFTTAVFEYFDVSYYDAILAADVLAYSDEHGIDSHGIARLKHIMTF